METAISFIPESLILHLDALIAGVDKKLKIESNQAIFQATRPRSLIALLQIGVTVQMHHHFGSRISRFQLVEGCITD